MEKVVCGAGPQNGEDFSPRPSLFLSLSWELPSLAALVWLVVRKKAAVPLVRSMERSVFLWTRRSGELVCSSVRCNPQLFP